jgi:hypothetical protein
MSSRLRTRVIGGLASVLLAIGLGITSAPSAAAAPCVNHVVGDTNGDGHADAAIGEPGALNSAGAVHLLYGTIDGLVPNASAGGARDDQLFTQDTAGVPGTPESGDSFGASTVLADFNGDHCADLAIGVPGENSDTGFVNVLYGSPSGVTTAGVQAFGEDTLFSTGSGRTVEEFGSTLAFGDLNDDGIADLVVGSPGEVVGSAQSAGGVAVIYGSAGGLNAGATNAVLITQDTPGVVGAAEENDRFGSALAVGDFDGHGVADLAVGVPGENGLSGIVEVLPGVAGTGVDPLHTVGYSQNTANVPGATESGDGFGSALAAGDVTGDSRSDLAIGVPGENGPGTYPGQVIAVGAGAVSFLPGSSTGLLTGTNSQFWSQDSPGVYGVAASTDQFGAALVMARLDNGALMDLAIGAPEDSIGSIDDSGSVTILLGRSTGLSTSEAGGERISQDSAGLPGTPEPGDLFGFALAAPLVQTPDQASLLVGVPGETIGSVIEVGLIHQLATNEFGPDTAHGRTFDQSTSGVQGDPVDVDLFGLALG